MKAMAGKIENGAERCAKFRKWMPDAAVGALSASPQADFTSHLRACVACSEEFQRVLALLQAIDSGVSASVAAEPSPQLIANVRQQIQHTRPARLWWPRTVWITASACAALVIALLAFHVLRTSNSAAVNPQHQRLAASAPAGNSARPSTTKPAVESAHDLPSRNPVTVFVRHFPSRTLRRAPLESQAPEAPEIIVQPGQMQAILRFAAAMQRGQIDGGQFLADQKKSNELLEIKPLTIAPLKIEPLDADSAAPSSSVGSEGSVKTSVSGHSD